MRLIKKFLIKICMENNTKYNEWPNKQAIHISVEEFKAFLLVSCHNYDYHLAVWIFKMQRRVREPLDMCQSWRETLSAADDLQNNLKSNAQGILQTFLTQVDSNEEEPIHIHINVNGVLINWIMISWKKLILKRLLYVSGCQGDLIGSD